MQQCVWLKVLHVAWVLTSKTNPSYIYIANVGCDLIATFITRRGELVVVYEDIISIIMTTTPLSSPKDSLYCECSLEWEVNPLKPQ